MWKTWFFLINLSKNTFLKNDFRPDQLIFDQEMIIFQQIFPIPEDNYHVLMCLPIIICTFDLNIRKPRNNHYELI